MPETQRRRQRRARVADTPNYLLYVNDDDDVEERTEVSSSSTCGKRKRYHSSGNEMISSRFAAAGGCTDAGKDNNKDINGDGGGAVVGDDHLALKKKQRHLNFMRNIRGRPFRRTGFPFTTFEKHQRTEKIKIQYEFTSDLYDLSANNATGSPRPVSPGNTVLVELLRIDDLLPSDEKQCPIACESYEKATLDFLGDDASFISGYPEYCVVKIEACGHMFSAMNLAYHFLTTHMKCPMCRTGGDRTASMGSMPFHLRSHFKKQMVIVEQREILAMRREELNMIQDGLQLGGRYAGNVDMEDMAQSLRTEIANDERRIAAVEAQMRQRMSTTTAEGIANDDSQISPSSHQQQQQLGEGLTATGSAIAAASIVAVAQDRRSMTTTASLGNLHNRLLERVTMFMNPHHARRSSAQGNSNMNSSYQDIAYQHEYPFVRSTAILFSDILQGSNAFGSLYASVELLECVSMNQAGRGGRQNDAPSSQQQPLPRARPGQVLHRSRGVNGEREETLYDIIDFDSLFRKREDDFDDNSHHDDDGRGGGGGENNGEEAWKMPVQVNVERAETNGVVSFSLSPESMSRVRKGIKDARDVARGRKEGALLQERRSRRGNSSSSSNSSGGGNSSNNNRHCNHRSGDVDALMLKIYSRRNGCVIAESGLIDFRELESNIAMMASASSSSSSSAQQQSTTGPSSWQSLNISMLRVAAQRGCVEFDLQMLGRNDENKGILERITGMTWVPKKDIVVEHVSLAMEEQDAET